MKKIFTFICTVLMAVAMFTASQYTYEAHALSEEEAAWVEEARLALQEIVAEREVMALVYMSDEYTVRTEPSEDSAPVVTVYSGHTVFVQDAVIDDEYRAWTKVSLYSGGQQYEGYIARGNLACSDERFLQWENEYGMNPGMMTMYAYALDGEMPNPKAQEIAQFPESYRAALTALSEKHPNWTFVPQKTNLDWNTVIANELVGGRSLVHSSFGDYTKEGAYDNYGWFYASKEILEVYMDPRNSLHEDAIFQFEQLTYNAQYHTQAAVAEFLKGTFMASDGTAATYAPGTVMSYDHIFWAIGAEEIRKVSPFHLAARVLQEQGVSGGSALISGNYEGAGGIYKGYYNYFNVGATGTSEQQVVENGLKYAKNATFNGQPYPWNNAYASILGGAEVISANYIKKGQDTLYLQKYNVGPDSQYPHYTHQYMQNISAPTSEAKSIKKLYASAGALESPFVFKIPVYENMPATACPKPTASTNVVLQVPAGYDGSVIYLDGVAYAPQTRNGRHIATAPNGNAKTAVAFKYNGNGVPVGMYVWTLEYKNNAYAVTAQPELADLLTYHGFSVRVTGKSGIRYKTGISTQLRSLLTTTGVNGYKLKEYGTLVMKNQNRGQYPMILGGEKVLSGLSYGINASGVLEDKVFETVDNRYRYTSVLVGLPATEYKTDYAFGGYITLEKNGVNTTIYGPVVAKSIYSLAQQILNMGTYPVGSEADVFLRKIITDADALQINMAQ